MPDPAYRERARIRVNGLLVRGNALLLVKIQSPVLNRPVWIPPGGGLEYGESMDKCLAREFREETGLEIEVGSLRHVNELLEPPYQAVEFYFEVAELGGELRLGADPEHPEDRQIISEVRFIPFDELTEHEVVPAYVQNRFIDDFKSGDAGITFSRSE